MKRIIWCKNSYHIPCNNTTRGNYNPAKSQVKSAVPSENLCSESDGCISNTVEPWFIQSPFDEGEGKKKSNDERQHVI